VRELRILVTTADAERFRGALVLAGSQAALGGKAAIFLQLDAVRLLRAPIAAPEDDAHAAAGLPRLAHLLDDVIGLGVAVIACQSGLALTGLSVDSLPSGITAGGPIGFLQQTLDDARIVIC
jgi:predicted peroxiredoxin